MVGRNKRKTEESSDDEVLANIKKTSASKKNGSKSNNKRSLGDTKRKSNKALESESEQESDYQLTWDDSDSEITAKRSKSTSNKRISERSSKTVSSRPKRDAETNKKRSLDRSKISHNKDSSEDDSQQSDAVERNGKESPKKQLSVKRAPKPKASKGEIEEEYEVEEILDFKIENKTKYFLVRWKGYDSSADSWVYQRDLHCTGLIHQFYEKRPEARATTSKRKKNADPFKPKKKNKLKKIYISVPKIDELPDYDSEAFDENQEWKVEKIIDIRFHQKTKTRDFLIRWEGFSSKSDSWEPEENLDCKELINKFMAKLEHISNATVKELRPVRKPTERYTAMFVDKGRRLSKRLDGRQRAAYYECE